MRNGKVKIKTSEIITQKELENGIWQFMVDHAVPFGKDLYQVKYLPITTKENLMRRIYARATFLYKIKDEEKIQKELEDKISYLQALEVGAKKTNKKQAALDNLKKKCYWKWRVIHNLRKLVNRLIKQWCNEV